MNVFKRLGDIISSNVNSVLDKMEDPEKMIDLSISELENSIIEMKTILAEKNAEVTGLERLYEDTIKSIERWNERAKLALGKKEEDMAREAVDEKIKATEKAKLQEESLKEMRVILSSLEDSKQEAEKKLQEMKIKSTELKTRARSAKEKKKVAEITSSPTSSRFERRLAEISAKIDKWEAYSDLSSTTKASSKIQKSYEDLEKESAIDKELAILKEEIKTE